MVQYKVIDGNSVNRSLDAILRSAGFPSREWPSTHVGVWVYLRELNNSHTYMHIHVHMNMHMCTHVCICIRVYAYACTRT